MKSCFFSYHLNHSWFIRKSFSILLFATCTFCQEKNDTKDKNLYSAPSLILCFIHKLHACKDSVLNRVKFRKLLYITKHYKILFSDINTIIMLFRADTTCKPLSLSSVLWRQLYKSNQRPSLAKKLHFYPYVSIAYKPLVHVHFIAG